MPSPIVANAVKVTVTGDLFGQLNQNVWGVIVAEPPTVAVLDNILDIFQSHYGDLVGPLSANLTYSSAEARYIGSADGPETARFFDPPITGGQAAAPSSPSNVALCVSLRSGLAGRRFRGRKFFSGIPEGAVANNLIDSTLCTAVVSAIGDLIVELAANNTPLAIISLVQLTVVEVISVICVDNYVDSQRRRLTGRGR